MNIGVMGSKGESMVARFLKDNGYVIVARNYQCRFGEIDIIAENSELIIFVEVKTRKEKSAVPIEEAVDLKKQKRMIITAEDFLVKTPTNKQPRFDVALVTIKRNNELNRDSYFLKYIENAF